MEARELGDGACSASMAETVAAVAADAALRRNELGAGRLTGACLGLMWHAVAHRGLASQAGGDARRHAAVMF